MNCVTVKNCETTVNTQVKCECCEKPLGFTASQILPQIAPLLSDKGDYFGDLFVFPMNDI